VPGRPRRSATTRYSWSVELRPINALGAQSRAGGVSARGQPRSRPQPALGGRRFGGRGGRSASTIAGPTTDRGHLRRRKPADPEGSRSGADCPMRLWEGGQTRFGNTCWRRSIRRLVASASAQVHQVRLPRARPVSVTTRTHGSRAALNTLPAASGGVSFDVTPFVLEYETATRRVGAGSAAVYDAHRSDECRRKGKTTVLAALRSNCVEYYAHSKGKPLGA